MDFVDRSSMTEYDNWCVFEIFFSWKLLTPWAEESKSEMSTYTKQKIIINEEKTLSTDKRKFWQNEIPYEPTTTVRIPIPIFPAFFFFFEM